MTRGGGDWLDTLARRSAGPATPSPRPTEADPSEDRLSRATALKLAVAGAASLSLGLWRVEPAAAFDIGGCLAGCLDASDKWLDRQLDACGKVFIPSYFDNDPTWKALLK